MSILNYPGDWFRDEISARAEEKPMRLEDAVAFAWEITDVILPGGQGLVNFMSYTEGSENVSPLDTLFGKTEWLDRTGYNNRLFQGALDQYVMRRNAWVVSAHCNCVASSYDELSLASSIASSITIKYGDTASKTYTISSDPANWSILSLHADDQHKGNTSIVRVSIVQYTNWRLLKVYSA